MSKLLNVGGGSKSIPIPDYYTGWQHDLLDIDPRGKPDIVLDARELHTLPPATYDSVYCSHNLEHYYRHDGARVVQGFSHVLRHDCFAEIRVPDLESVMRHVVQYNLDIDDQLYQSPAGPILVRDVFYGYHVEIERSGNDYYAHKTGFSPRSLSKFIVAHGFPWVAIGSRNQFEILAFAFKQRPTEERQRMLGVRFEETRTK
jgi:hypothetical protein